MTDTSLKVMTDESHEEMTDNIFSGLPSEALAKLSPAKNRTIMLYITGMYRVKDLARVIGVSETTIRNWLPQPEVQMVIQSYQEREHQLIDASLKALRYRAVDTMNNLMDSPMDAVRFQASKDILDRTGHKPVTEMKIDKTVRTIEEQLKELADVVIDDAEIIDISDVVEQVKQSYDGNK